VYFFDLCCVVITVCRGALPTTYFYCIDRTKLARYLYIYVQMMSLHNQVNLKLE